MLSPENDIKNYTWKDKEYYKLYQRELYQRRLGVKCICENCGRQTTNKNLKKHQTTMKCMNSIKPGEPTFKERVEKMEQFEKMLVNLGIHLDKDKDVAIARG
jgi:polyphosphate kinase 2 (PPK2 family)